MSQDFKSAAATARDRATGFAKEFRQFISRGNVVDLAVGVIIGAAFGKIVTSLVGDILMPVIGTVLGGINLLSLQLTIWGNAHIALGSFLQNIIDFVIVAFSIFIFIKFINRFLPRPKSAPAPVADQAAEKSEREQTKLLREIRDSLRKK
jgi:large conductance mechanosensitive channel